MDLFIKKVEQLIPELKLLLVCCGSKRWDVEELLKVINEEKLIKQAKYHRVIPLVNNFINENKNLFNNEIAYKISQFNQVIVKRNLNLTAALIKIGKILDNNNITWFSFKGPILSQIIYHDIFSRSYRDIDILVEEHSFETCVNVLQSMGYKIQQDLALKDILKYNHNVELFNEAENVKVEIHSRLFVNQEICNPLHIKHFDKINFINIQNHPIPSFEDAAHFSFLCIHGALHQFSELQWILDSVYVYKSKEYDSVKRILIENNLKPVIQLVSQLNELLFEQTESIKRPYSPLLKDCLVQFSTVKVENTWSKLFKTRYLWRISTSFSYRKKLLNYRLFRIFKNPAKRIA